VILQISRIGSYSGWRPSWFLRCPGARQVILTRKEFALALRAQLDQGHDPVRIARWAYELHLSARSFEEGLESDILQLIAMDMGEEYEIGEQELQRIANRGT